MSDPGLVLRQGSMAEIEQALRTATDDIRTFLTDLLDTVDAQTAGWTEETPSRQAQRRFERALGDGVTRLGDALDRLAEEVAAHAERSRAIEVENVAIVG
ncbi:hypothetical protein [Nocardioides sp. SYSU DS0663]|uniref:hypothetical protein n=1 Tax=Nocardioides sp. SYSU DS0663 TaxID=3416445 RepID=UPI003F4B2344